MSQPEPQQSKAAPAPLIQIFETTPVAYNAGGITVTVPVTVTLKATVRRTVEQVRGWLTDTDNPAASTPNNGAADADWLYTVPLTAANKTYLFKAALVEVAAGGGETEVVSDELTISTN